MNTTKPSQTIYDTVTNKIIEAIEAGVMPWVKPWSHPKCGLPRNAITGREYSGINTLILSMSSYQQNTWLTYNQAREAGGQVRKGEHGAQVVFYKSLTVKDKEGATSTGEIKEKSIPMLRIFTVFNTEQIDNLPLKLTAPAGETSSAPLSAGDINDLAESLISNTKADITYNGNRACYIPSQDKIILPPQYSYKEKAAYYSTALHELTHWTGHKDRLARNFEGRYGDASYAFEELIAEIGSAFLCASCKVDGILQHAEYIASWLKVLRSDNKAIFAASAAARRAAVYVTGDTAEVQC